LFLAAVPSSTCAHSLKVEWQFNATIFEAHAGLITLLSTVPKGARTLNPNNEVLLSNQSLSTYLGPAGKYGATIMHKDASNVGKESLCLPNSNGYYCSNKDGSFGGSLR
jgi:hypothetical protein